jgi:hypothetical protein
MFKMQTNYTMANLSLNNPGQKGVLVNCKVSAASAVSLFSLRLFNAFHECLFQMTPQEIRVGVTGSVRSLNVNGSEVASPNGEAKVLSVTGTSLEASISLWVSQRTLNAKVSYEGKSTLASYTISDEVPLDISSGWRVEVTSNSVPGIASSTTMDHLYIVGDSNVSGEIHTEFFTLSAQDILNKYVDLQGTPSLGTAVNVAQSTTQREGIDFVVIGNRLYWEGYGLDIPQMVAGITLRVIYYGGAQGEPAFNKISKRVVTLRGDT